MLQLQPVLYDYQNSEYAVISSPRSAILTEHYVLVAATSKQINVQVRSSDRKPTRLTDRNDLNLVFSAYFQFKQISI